MNMASLGMSLGVIGFACSSYQFLSAENNEQRRSAFLKMAGSAAVFALSYYFNSNISSVDSSFPSSGTPTALPTTPLPGDGNFSCEALKNITSLENGSKSHLVHRFFSDLKCEDFLPWKRNIEEIQPGNLTKSVQWGIHPEFKNIFLAFKYRCGLSGKYRSIYCISKSRKKCPLQWRKVLIE